MSHGDGIVKTYTGFRLDQELIEKSNELLDFVCSYYDCKTRSRSAVIRIALRIGFKELEKKLELQKAKQQGK